MPVGMCINLVPHPVLQCVVAYANKRCPIPEGLHPKSPHCPALKPSILKLSTPCIMAASHCFPLQLNVHFFPFSFGAQPPVGQGLLFHEVVRSHSTHYNRLDSSRRVIGSSRRSLPDNTQHPNRTDMSLVGFEPTISAGDLPHTYALDRAATGTGKCTLVVIEISYR